MNDNKENYIKISVFDAGYYGNRYHTYVFENKLFMGKGYESLDGYSNFNFYPETDEVLIDDVSKMEIAQLKGIKERVNND